MQRDALRDYLDGVLETARFRDYCPNGLQVEGRARACQYSIRGFIANIA